MDGSDLDDIDLQTDFGAVAAQLDREPEGPSFVLPANRFHVHRAKAEAKAKRRGIKKFIRPENARQILPHLPGEPGDRTHAILRGDFVLCDLIPAILAERGWCATLHVATLGLSAANAESLATLHRGGQIGAITLLCSTYFREVDKTTTYREVTARLQGIARIVVARNHAKVICLPTAAGDHFVIEGSANLRSSDNLEQIAVFNDPELAAFHRGWIDTLAADA